MSLDPWADMLTDTVALSVMSEDSWGNPTVTSTTVVDGRIISRSLDGGGENQSERTAGNLWRLRVVIPLVDPLPSNADPCTINGDTYEIDNVTVHEDHSGKAIELSVHNYDTGVQP